MMLALATEVVQGATEETEAAAAMEAPRAVEKAGSLAAAER